MTNQPLTDQTRTHLRFAVYAVTVAMVLYLALIAIYPWLLDRLRPWTGWFGASGSVATIVIVCATIGLACVIAWRSSESHRTVGLPIGVTVALTGVSAALGFSSYVWCHDEAHPRFITALLWTGGVMRGALDDRRVAPGMGLCPAHAPVALEVAKIAALAALLVGIAGIAAALLESRLDRVRLRFDPSITAIVGADSDADSMVAAVARTLEKNTTLLVVTTPADAEHRGMLRRGGARVVAVDFSHTDVLQSLPIWHKVKRLYLLSPDPSTNLQRLSTINDCLPADQKRRPLTVRIDDPWQAEAWRRRQLGGSDSRWAGDAIGKYEVTAHRLIDRIVDEEHTDRIIVCGTTPLTLALCANLSRRRLERNFYSEPRAASLPTLSIVGTDAEEYRQNEEIHLTQLGCASARDWLRAVEERPSASSLTAMVRRYPGSDPISTAVIVADESGNSLLGTMLAARLPDVAIYVFAPDAPEISDIAGIVGRLQTFRLTMDLPAGHSQDVWERAAKLIHNRYAAQVGGSSPAVRPWAQLDEFYRGSNRRQVRNALWMVEQIGGRVWDSSAAQAGTPVAGIGRTASLAMAEAEHQDWCRYYREAGWRYGPVREDAHKIHNGLVSWQNIQSDPVALDRALKSLASTLSALDELGYRSVPAWQRFRRTGTVIAEQRSEAWSWKSASGQSMQAGGGDWAVGGRSGQTWSVRDDVFQSTHEQLDGTHWRRTGEVRARKARAGEVVETLEGPLTAQHGDWIVRGPAGEEWPVGPEIFREQYEGPLAEDGATR